jgi:hypothetical protein
MHKWLQVTVATLMSALLAGAGAGAADLHKAP